MTLRTYETKRKKKGIKWSPFFLYSLLKFQRVFNEYAGYGRCLVVRLVFNIEWFSNCKYFKSLWVEWVLIGIWFEPFDSRFWKNIQENYLNQCNYIFPMFMNDNVVTPICVNSESFLIENNSLFSTLHFIRMKLSQEQLTLLFKFQSIDIFKTKFFPYQTRRFQDQHKRNKPMNNRPSNFPHFPATK